MLRLLRVELEKLALSRLFYATLALFVLYALVLVVGFRAMMASFGGLGGDRQSGAAYLYLAFVLSFYPFAVTVAIVFAGGSVSQELRAGTLRYTLLAPVARWQYLAAKFLVTAAAVAAVMLFLFLLLGALGLLLFGHGNVLAYDVWGPGKPHARVATLFNDEETLQRCFLALPLAVHSAVGNASPAFLVSTLVDSPLLAITIPLSLFFISSIIQFSQFLTVLEPYLPTRHMFFWDDVFVREIPWDGIGQGIAFHGFLMLVFVGLAMVLFAARDVTR